MPYWTRPPRAGRRHRRLTADDIAAAALALLAEDGAENLTLRRLAARLGVAQSSLYAHVDTREDVLDLALDAALAADPRVWAAADEGDLRGLMLAWYDHLVDHPWAAAQVARTTPLGPAYLALADRVCHLLAEAGTAPPDILPRSYALTSFVLGCATTRGNHTGGSYDDLPCLADRPHLHRAVTAASPSWRSVVDHGLAAILAAP